MKSSLLLPALLFLLGNLVMEKADAAGDKAQEIGRGMQSKVHVAKMPKPASERVRVLSTEKAWKEYWKLASSTSPVDDRTTPPKVDFRKQKVLVIRNVRFCNSMRLISGVIEDDARSVTIRVRETRTARPIDPNFYFVAITVPRDVDTVVEGKNKTHVGTRKIDASQT